MRHEVRLGACFASFAWFQKAFSGIFGVLGLNPPFWSETMNGIYGDCNMEASCIYTV